VRKEAEEVAAAIADSLDIVGLVAVEMFLTSSGEILVNELAPRPHNSGHFSFDACVTSQFEQQLRAACLLPLGETSQLTPAVMWNILGDQWQGGEPPWAKILDNPMAKLHLYGKHPPRPGRKMGHLTLLGDIDESLQRLRDIRRGPEI